VSSRLTLTQKLATLEESILSDMKSIIHVACNLIVRNCMSKCCCQVDTFSSNTSEPAKSADTATNDTTEHGFVATGIDTCRANIISTKIFQLTEITRKVEIPEENREWTEDRNSNVDFPFVSMILVCPHVPLHEHTIIRSYCYCQRVLLTLTQA
jgi:hypothetical protein